jgi:hypothetical protein
MPGRGSRRFGRDEDRASGRRGWKGWKGWKGGKLETDSWELIAGS